LSKVTLIEKPDELQFMNIAQGSLEERRFYLILAQDLKSGNNSSGLK
jgi:hypothetical protein